MKVERAMRREADGSAGDRALAIAGTSGGPEMIEARHPAR
jgi:hypothetical protein